VDRARALRLGLSMIRRDFPRALIWTSLILELVGVAAAFFVGIVTLVLSTLWALVDAAP